MYRTGNQHAKINDKRTLDWRLPNKKSSCVYIKTDYEVEESQYGGNIYSKYSNVICVDVLNQVLIMLEYIKIRSNQGQIM